jgi:hypothetical protein
MCDTCSLGLVDFCREGAESERESERRGEVFHVMTCHLLKLTCFGASAVSRCQVLGEHFGTLYYMGAKFLLPAACVAAAKDSRSH